MNTTSSPVLFSVLVYPGIGQFMQKRILPGLVYAGSFTILLGVMIVITFRQILSFLQAVEAIQQNTAVDPALLPDVKTLLKPLLVLLFIYLANVYDVWNARRRALRT